MITEQMRCHVEKYLSVDYDIYINQHSHPINSRQFLEITNMDLSYRWIEKYQNQCAQAASVLSITLDAYTFLWDETYERVVVVYGISKNVNNKEKHQREKSRIAYYYRNFTKRYQLDAAMDTGHFIAHSLGGGLDINLFPQKRSINRGHSAEGALYRQMEIYAMKHPETFVFSRPVYFDDTWRPFFLEYGVLKTDPTLWTHMFDNV